MAKKKLDKYQEFLISKQRSVKPSGFEVQESEINPLLFKFQNACVRWAVRLGKAALFEECGLGKTLQQLEFARLVTQHTGGKALIFAPLAVADQTIDEALKLGLTVPYVKDQSEVGDNAIVITNYERLENFEPDEFVCVVLDESSILKGFSGKTKAALIRAFKATPYKLCCTATPSPNDITEIGNHAEFLGIKTQAEMQSTWFVNDAGDTGTWVLKGHAEKDFYRWLTSWAVFISNPSDLGEEYAVDGYDLPKLNIIEHRLQAPQASIDRAWANGELFPNDRPSSTGMHKVKRESLSERVETSNQIVSDDRNGTWAIWCDTNYEADELVKAFPEAVEVHGSQNPELKRDLLHQFSKGEKPMIISKAEIAGYGLNWQHCHNMIFVGLSYSFEKTYQAMRRCWRFGQEHEVNAHLIYAETEGNIMVTLNHKQEEFKKLQAKMNEAMHENGFFRDTDYASVTTGKHDMAEGENFKLYLGDCVERIDEIADNSIGFSIYSPPFPDIFMYTDSFRDMGNVANDAEFFEGYKEHLLPKIYRILMPGRLVAVHCVDLPSFKYKHGVQGLRDFPGEIIKAHQECGFIYHSRITVWKNPVVEMQRTKAHALLHKNFVAKAEQVRQGLPDYVLVFRKPEDEMTIHVEQHREPGDYVGTNPPLNSNELVENSVNRWYSIQLWQNYASPVWFDIEQGNVLNGKLARESEDQKHIAPLQLDVIERCIDLWSNKGDVVFTPFAGIGSEVYSALKLGRKGIGIELKESYWKQAIKFCKEMEQSKAQKTLFDLLPIEEEQMQS